MHLNKKMKKYLFYIILSFLITTSVSARKTGCEGNWVGTQKQGQGVETWPNGYIYKGEFKNSVWSGKGILTFPNGATYDGEWVNGFMNGKGTFTWSDGREKMGIWKNGKLQE